MMGENIRRLRDERGWTQADLARIAGVDEAFVSKIECGHKNAGKRTITRLCEAFAVDEQTLRYGERKEEPPTNDLGRLAESEVRKLFAMARDDNERLALSGDLFRFLAERRRELADKE